MYKLPRDILLIIYRYIAKEFQKQMHKELLYKTKMLTTCVNMSGDWYGYRVTMCKVCKNWVIYNVHYLCFACEIFQEL